MPVAAGELMDRVPAVGPVHLDDGGGAPVGTGAD